MKLCAGKIKTVSSNIPVLREAGSNKLVAYVDSAWRDRIVLACNHFDEMREIISDLSEIAAISLGAHTFKERAKSLLAKLEAHDDTTD